MNNGIRVAMIGPGGVGKTEILRRLSGQPFRPAYHPTHGSETWDLLVDGIRFIVTEYSGQEQLRNVPQEELDAIEAYIVVATESSVDMRAARKLQKKMPDNIPHCLVVNKIDVKGSFQPFICTAKGDFGLRHIFLHIASFYDELETN
jgi:small GTP-binding protein